MKSTRLVPPFPLVLSVAAVLAAAAVTLVACSSDDDDSTTPQQDAGVYVDGGVMMGLPPPATGFLGPGEAGFDFDDSGTGTVTDGGPFVPRDSGTIVTPPDAGPVDAGSGGDAGDAGDAGQATDAGDAGAADAGSDAGDAGDAGK